MLILGVIVVLLTLGMLAFYTVFQDTLTRAYATARHAYVTVMHPHLPFALLPASMVIAGLGWAAGQSLRAGPAGAGDLSSHAPRCPYPVFYRRDADPSGQQGAD